MREIYDEVTRIDEELKQDGHIVDINSVPIGSVHSGKKTNVIRQCCNSFYYMCLEKLAIALALIYTPPGSAIVLTKNLRVCPDCHEMAKRLSRLREREIIISKSCLYINFPVALFERSFLLQQNLLSIHFLLIVGDSFRYHIFNNGQCSCGDFL
jgi:hypothetical protein